MEPTRFIVSFVSLGEGGIAAPSSVARGVIFLRFWFVLIRFDLIQSSGNSGFQRIVIFLVLVVSLDYATMRVFFLPMLQYIQG